MKKNIRATLALALEDFGPVDTAMNGEEALRKIQENEYRLVLLDLRMPGMDGLAVLKKIAECRPEIRIVIITAHGTIENAVEAMKHGAMDFLRKPFTSEEIRELARQVLDREKIDRKRTEDYKSCIELAKLSIAERHLEAALEFLHKAAYPEPHRPEIFNLMGAVHEIRGENREALKHYRTAYWIAPSYDPARENLERLSDSLGLDRRISMDDPTKETGGDS
ncbi:MAG: response regulator [Thermodesulfobacteriota bacterium]|nr:response regulator [Thermodesulfobacteriota bacterium]